MASKLWRVIGALALAAGWSMVWGQTVKITPPGSRAGVGPSILP